MGAYIVGFGIGTHHTVLLGRSEWHLQHTHTHEMIRVAKRPVKIDARK